MPPIWLTKPILNRKTQDRILSALASSENRVLAFYNDDVSFKRLVELMILEKCQKPEEENANTEEEEEPTEETEENSQLKELNYHLTLIHLLASCAQASFPTYLCKSALGPFLISF